jgi:hypothetical protein
MPETTTFSIGEWVRVKRDVADHTTGGVGTVAAINEFVWVKFTDTVLPYAPEQLESVAHLKALVTR